MLREGATKEETSPSRPACVAVVKSSSAITEIPLSRAYSGESRTYLGRRAPTFGLLFKVTAA